MVIPALFLFTGFSAKIRNWAQKIGKKWFWIIGIYFVFFSLITFVIDLPLSYYEEFVRQHAYNLSNQTFGKWLGDSLKSLMVGIIIGFLFLWLPYLALKKSPKRWWLFVGIGTVPFLFLTLLISPIWIDPLFNDYGPMKDKALETKILALAERAGIEGSKVFEVNKSVDTKTLNAYVTGFLDTKRIVIWDNTIAKMNERELLFVLGHEMGHYLLGHIWKLIFFYSFLILVTLYIADRVAASLIGKFKQRLGFKQLSDIASLPLIILLFNLFGFIIIAPIGNWFSRSIEHQSDQFGLEITKDNHSAATAFVKLQAENLSNPRPGALYKLWRANHPVLGDRIDYANEYKPWGKNEKLEFEKYFKK
jgi:Zn-dependent protease with chaperone function